MWNSWNNQTHTYTHACTRTRTRHTNTRTHTHHVMCHANEQRTSNTKDLKYTYRLINTKYLIFAQPLHKPFAKPNASRMHQQTQAWAHALTSPTLWQNLTQRKLENNARNDSYLRATVPKHLMDLLVSLLAPWPANRKQEVPRGLARSHQ